MRRLILSFFGAGLLRPAPGTWGSLAALPAAWALHALAGPGGLIVATAALYGIGVSMTAQETAASEDHDPSWIVIDEVVGQWIALFPVSLGAYSAGVDALRLWPGIVAAFVFFRTDVQKTHAGVFQIQTVACIGHAHKRVLQQILGIRADIGTHVQHYVEPLRVP